MELTLDRCGTVAAFQTLEENVEVVDGASVRRDGKDAILEANSEDAVWNVWRAVENTQHAAEGTNEGVYEASQNIRDQIEEKMD